MLTCPVLEIGLYRGDESSKYIVELRFIDPQNNIDARKSGHAQFDVDRLKQLTLSPLEYGQCLTNHLFTDPNIRSKFVYAQGMVGNRSLRLRLAIGANATELHTLHWEMLRHPDTGESLLCNEHLLFSRYLSKDNWRPIELSPPSQLQALVAIANPENLADYAPAGTSLTPVNVEQEYTLIRESLAAIPTTFLVTKGAVTLNAIITHLRNGADICYLVAHGALIKGKPHLWLEKENGQTDVVNGELLVSRMQELRHPPRLVVLASCQSAGTGESEGDALKALGPRLAEKGIPAVLAMQGAISMETIAQFMPIFFRELQRDGQIDHAVAVARSMVMRERHDWWMPVLFLRETNMWKTPADQSDVLSSADTSPKQNVHIQNVQGFVNAGGTMTFEQPVTFDFTSQPAPFVSETVTDPSSAIAAHFEEMTQLLQTIPEQKHATQISLQQQIEQFAQLLQSDTISLADAEPIARSLRDMLKAACSPGAHPLFVQLHGESLQKTAANIPQLVLVTQRFATEVLKLLET